MPERRRPMQTVSSTTAKENGGNSNQGPLTPTLSPSDAEREKNLPIARTSASVDERTNTLFDQAHEHILRRTDRMFAWLMGFQWLAGIIAALIISPRTWIGATSQGPIHVWGAVFLGGAISAFPIFLALKRPGRASTRHVIAIAQMLTSALLIHLTGGRIETHFHVFGSLAFLAFYRDWRVLISATVVVALDHMLRGIYLPQSVFGVFTPSPWRWLEHAGWVIFEDSFLIVSIRHGLREMRQAAERQASLEALNQTIEQRVHERTRDLEKEIHERIETQSKLQETHKQLLQVSRQAGMAEVATGVLHNVGNVLNSVSVSATVVCDRLRQSEIDDLRAAAAMLEGKNGGLAEFLTDDPKGKLIPKYLAKASKLLATQRDELVSEKAGRRSTHRTHQRNCGHATDLRESVRRTGAGRPGSTRARRAAHQRRSFRTSWSSRDREIR